MNVSPSDFSAAGKPGLLAFLREELASSPARWRSALRVTLLCFLGTAFVMGAQIPDGQFFIIFLFAVNQPDAWASFRKAWLRGAGILFGGVVALFSVLAFADYPWLFFGFQSVVIAATFFLSRTITIPYVAIMAGFSFLLLTPGFATTPAVGLSDAIWRIVLATLGAVAGTVAQLVLWPDHPENLLRDELANQLRRVERILKCAMEQPGVAGAQRAASNERAGEVTSSMARQLDLLGSAETRSRWLRQRHTEQVKLITDVERLFTTALRLKRWVTAESPSRQLTAPARERLDRVCKQCAEFRHALETGQSLDVNGTRPVGPPGAEDGHSSPEAAIHAMERVLREMPASLAFLAHDPSDLSSRASEPNPVRTPVAERQILTPDCTLANADVVRFTLKGTLAATLCYFLYQGLNWPGISTCVATCLLVASTSFGAGVQRSLVLFSGAMLGAVGGLLAVTMLLPNMVTLASFLVVTGVLYFVAAWILAGGSRTSYAGVQMGLTLSLVLLADPGPTTNLAPAGDRVLGVLLGIAVMSLIEFFLWPQLAGPMLRKKLADTLRTLAEIPRNMARLDWDKASESALAVHRNLASALRLYGEWKLEPDATSGEIGVRREWWLGVVGRLEEIHLSLLGCVRQRRALGKQNLPSAWTGRLHEVDESLANDITTLANSIGVSEPVWAGDSANVLGKFEQALSSVSDGRSLSPGELAQLREYASLVRELLVALPRLRGELAAAHHELAETSSISPRAVATN